MSMEPLERMSLARSANLRGFLGKDEAGEGNVHHIYGNDMKSGTNRVLSESRPMQLTQSRRRCYSESPIWLVNPISVRRVSLQEQIPHQVSERRGSG